MNQLYIKFTISIKDSMGHGNIHMRSIDNKLVRCMFSCSFCHNKPNRHFWTYEYDCTKTFGIYKQTSLNKLKDEKKITNKITHAVCINSTQLLLELSLNTRWSPQTLFPNENQIDKDIMMITPVLSSSVYASKTFTLISSNNLIHSLT